MFKKLKSIFIVEAEDEKGDVKDVVKGIESKKAQSNNQPTPISNEKVDPKKASKRFTEILLKALERENLEGIDYLEYKQRFKALDGVLTDDAQKTKSAFAVSQAGGLTKENLLASGNHYLNVLGKEREKFEATYKRQQEVQIQSKDEEIKGLTNQIAAKKEQIKSIEQEILQMEKQLEKEKIEVNESASKVQLTKDQFLASYAMIVNQINADFENIKKYI